MPLNDIQKTLDHRRSDVEAWLNEKWKGLRPPIYLSCDVRHSGFKIAVIDSNLFPSGFNNLCNSFSRMTAESFREHLDTYHPQVKKILLFGEEHTRNKFYLKNLLHLKKLLDRTGRETRIGFIGQLFPEESFEIVLDDGTIFLERIQRIGNTISIGPFLPDLVLSNNDFASGVPQELKNLSQPIIPSPSLGWVERRKQHHFHHLSKLLDEFGQNFRIDPWFLSAETAVVSGVDLSEKDSIRRISEKVDELVESIRKKYTEHGLSETPYVYIKSARGTYGMGLLTVFSGEEVLQLNRRRRNKLAATKGGAVTTDYLIQEGIATADTYSGYPIEPVVYVVGKKDVGGFFRIHPSRNYLESLNAPGADFFCLCLHKLNEPHEGYFLDCAQKESVVNLSRLLARLDALAVAMETANKK